MIINKKDCPIGLNGRQYTIGGKVISTSASEYPGLIGTLTEIRTDEDKETDNEGADMYCSFELPVLPHEIKNITNRASKLYGETRLVPDLGLDLMIMAPDMIVPVQENGLYENNCIIYIIRESWAIGGECGHDEFVTVSYADAAYRFRALVKEMLTEINSEWYVHPDFTASFSDTHYECYIDGDYCYNHYEITLIDKYLGLPPCVMHRISDDFNERIAENDVAKIIDSEEEFGDISESEIKIILQPKDIYRRLEGIMPHDETYDNPYLYNHSR